MTKTHIAFALLTSSIACTSAQAQTQQPPIGFGGHLAYVSNDAGSGSDLDGSLRFEGFGQLQFAPNIALEVGISHSTGAEETGEDNTGSYKIEISSTDYFTGLRIDTQPWGSINGYGRAGVLYYHSTIDFEESFFDIKPGGDLEEIEEGTGFYLEGGIALQIAPGAKLDAGITWRNRQDYFEDSIRPFDMKELGATIGIVFTTR